MLGLVDAARAYRLDPAAREAVLHLAAELMWRDPSHDARSAVREAVDKLTTPCAGCGVRYTDTDWTVSDCDVCGQAVCERCAARVRRESSRLAVEIVVCPVCLAAADTPAGAERIAYALALKEGVEAEIQRYAEEIAALGRWVDVAA